MRHQRMDSIALDGTYYTEEGYLVDHPIVTTCGIFEYKNEDGSTRRELRLPEDVFAEESLKSYKGKPVIITHDAGEIDKDNVRSEQIGTIMSEGIRDGDSVRCEIIIHDTNALKKCGLKELSLGYSLDTVETPGTWKGEPYDCIQKNIEINHLAIVAEARAGEKARLNIDSKESDKKIILKGGNTSMKHGTTAYRMDDGDLTQEELDAAIALFKAQKAAENAGGATAADEGGGDPAAPGDPGEDPEKEKTPVEQVRANVDRRDAEGSNMAPEDIIAEQKADIETLLSEIDKLEAAKDMVEAEEATGAGSENQDSEGAEASTEDPEKEKGVNMDAMDRLLNDRLDVLRMADRLNLDGLDRLSITECRKRIIKAIRPKMNLDGKSETYIKAAYDMAKSDYKDRRSTDAQRESMAAAKARQDAKEECGSDSARKRMVKNMLEGGKK